MAKNIRPYAAMGKNIARLRDLRGFTQEKTAEKIGISIKYFQALEGGTKAPAFATLSRLKKVLGCSWNDLLADC